MLGVVENMTSFDCPRCGVSSGLFPTSTGGADSLCTTQHDSGNQLSVLGRIPLDARLTRCLDEGRCPFEELDTSSQGGITTRAYFVKTFILLNFPELILIFGPCVIECILHK